MGSSLDMVLFVPPDSLSGPMYLYGRLSTTFEILMPYLVTWEMYNARVMSLIFFTRLLTVILTIFPHTSNRERES